jgi:hypothetical protein
MNPALWATVIRVLARSLGRILTGSPLRGDRTEEYLSEKSVK